jgi:serine O-acetyltransferase
MLATSDPVWAAIKQEARNQAHNEPALASFLHATILNHDTLEDALSYHLAQKLGSAAISPLQVREIIDEALASDPRIGEAVRADIQAVYERDSACNEYCLPFLYFKGFQALQCYRVAHWLWNQGRFALAHFFQSHIALTFGVDIHPAARLGKGIMLDHATGIVIGETSVVEDDVSIMQSVTLGGTGKETGDRHPKVRKGVLISAGAKILGNIEVGEGAKVGAGSVVLKPVPPHTTVVGVPAEVVGKPRSASPALDMNHEISCDGDCDG